MATTKVTSADIKDADIVTADLANDAVTYAKMQNVSATDKVLGRTTAGSGDVEEIPCSATAAINTVPRTGGTYATLDRLWVPSGGTGRYWKAGTTNYTAWMALGAINGIALTTKALAANTAYAVPFLAPDRASSLDRLEVYVSTGVAATNIRIGIYNNISETGLFPGSILIDAGAGSSASSSTKITLTINMALVPGQLYWAVVVSDGTPTIRAIASNGAAVDMGTTDSSATTFSTHLSVTHTYGALQSTFPTSGLAILTTGPHGVFARFSA